MANCPSSLSGRGGSSGLLLGLCEDSESMHHHLKMMPPNGRARSVGRHRQLLGFHGYQAHVAITALLAWHHRTGADLSRWFGQWNPPNHAVAAYIYMVTRNLGPGGFSAPKHHSKLWFD